MKTTLKKFVITNKELQQYLKQFDDNTIICYKYPNQNTLENVKEVRLEVDDYRPEYSVIVINLTK